MNEVALGLTAFLSLVPASLAAVARAHAGRAPDRDAWFWLALGLAVSGPMAWLWAQSGGIWLTSLAAALWVCIVVCLGLYALLSVLDGGMARLGALLLPYLAVLGLLAAATGTARGPALQASAPMAWLDLHIAISVVTYALATLAAVAAFAAFLQERALKAKRPTALSRQLPPLAAAERLQLRLLVASEMVLGIGLASGMAVEYSETGAPLVFDHKVLFSLATFVVIGGLLIAQATSGVRGRRAARLVLVAYLLLTLAYPGVKFVSEILIGHQG